MPNSYVTDEKGRNIYHVYNAKTPYGGVVRTIKYEFGDKNYGIAFVARDCLDMLGYKYDNSHPNGLIYKYVSKENIINGKNSTPDSFSGVTSNNIYIRTRRNHNQIKPVVMVTQNGFFELVGRSNMPDALKFQHWVYNEVIPAVNRGENMTINRHGGGEIFKFTDSASEEVGIPNIRGTQEDQIKELMTNYARLRRKTYSMAAQDFKKVFWNAYHIDINKLKGDREEYKKIVANGLYDQAKTILNILICQCSSANIEYASENATEVSQLTNVITDLSYKNIVYKDFINSVPNCTIIDGIPYQRKRVVRRLTKEQMDAINEYASKHGIDPVEAMHVLFD